MSGWSLDEMDDMIWNEFHQTKERIVPDPRDVKESTWTASGKQWKKLHCQNSNIMAKSADQKMLGVNNSIFEGKVSGLSGSDSNGEVSAQSLNVDTWVVLDDEELATTTYNPMHVGSALGIDPRQEGLNADYCRDVKSVNSDLILGYCKEDTLLADRDAAVVNNSSQFLLSDISPPEGDLDFFEGDNSSETSNGMLEYNWENMGNFEEVEKLFRDSTLSEAMDSSSDELIWHTASFVPTNNSHPRSLHQGMDSSNPGIRHIGSSEHNEHQVKMEGVSCDNSSSLVFNQKDDSEVDYIQHNDQTSGPNTPLKRPSVSRMLGSQENTENVSGTLSEKKQLKICGKLEEATGSQSKCSNDQTSTTYQYTNKVDSNLMRTISNNIDKKDQMKFPDNGVPLDSQKPQVPYIHAGYGYPLPCLLMMPSSSSPRPHGQQSQPYFATYQMPADTLNQHQPMKQHFDILSGPPIMTPQDKIEKLRWRQQMQHKIAIDHKQQNTSMDTSLPYKHPQKMHYQQANVKSQERADGIRETSTGEQEQKDNASVDCGFTFDNEDCSLEAAMLCQLRTSVTQLDIQTRLNIRDALYRLARSAVQRHSANDIKSNNVIRGEDIGTDLTATSCIQLDRSAGIPNLETETNAIDRTVAHLLFHRSATDSAGQSSTVTEVPSGLMSCMDPQILPEALCSDLWNSSALHSSSWLGTNPSATVQSSLPGKVAIPMSESCIGATNEGINNMQGSSSLATCNACSLLFHPQVCDPPTSGYLRNTGIESLSKHQDAPQSNNYASDAKHNCHTKTNAVLENGKGLLSHHMNKTAISQPNDGNEATQGSLENMDVDLCNIDADVMVTEESSKVRANNEHSSYTEIENAEHVVQPISPPARTMLVH